MYKNQFYSKLFLYEWLLEIWYQPCQKFEIERKIFINVCFHNILKESYVNSVTIINVRVVNDYISLDINFFTRKCCYVMFLFIYRNKLKQE